MDDLDPVLQEYANRYRKVNTNQQIGAGLGTLAATSNTLARQGSALQNIEYFKTPTIGLSPEEVAAYTKGISDLHALKAEGKISEAAAVNKQNDSVLEQAIKLTEKELAARGTTSAALVAAKGKLADTRLRNVTDQPSTEAQPIPKELLIFTESPGGADVADINVLQTYIDRTKNSSPADKAKLFKELEATFQGMGMTYEDAVQHYSQDMQNDQIRTDLVTLQDNLAQADAASEAAKQAIYNELVASLSAGPGDAGKLFKKNYDAITASVNGTPEERKAALEKLSADATKEQQPDEVDMQIDAFNKELGNPRQVTPANYVKQQMLADPRFADFKTKTGIQDDTQAMRVLLQMAQRGRQQQRGLASSKLSEFRTTGSIAQPVTPKPAVGLPTNKVTSAAALPPPVPKQTVLSRAGDPFVYITNPDGTITPMDKATRKISPSIKPGTNPVFDTNMKTAVPYTGTDYSSYLAKDTE